MATCGVGVGEGVGRGAMRAMVTCVTISRCGSEEARGARTIDASNACTASASSNAPAKRRAPEEGAPRRMRERSVSVEIESLIRTIPDFPIPGIRFRDITPLLKDRLGFRRSIDAFAERFTGRGIDYVVGIEARGYIFGAPLAYAIGAGFIPVRKPGKLPYQTLSEVYALEYGSNALEIHADALSQGHRVVIVDDLLATGGTAAATRRLLERLGATVEAFGFVIELKDLNGRAEIAGSDIVSLVTY